MRDVIGDLIDENDVSEGLTKYVSKYLDGDSEEIESLNDFFRDMGFSNEYGDGGVLNHDGKGVQASFGFNHFDPENNLRIYRNYFQEGFEEEPDVQWFKFLFTALDEGLNDRYFNKISENSQGSRKFRIDLTSIR